MVQIKGEKSSLKGVYGFMLGMIKTTIKPEINEKIEDNSAE